MAVHHGVNLVQMVVGWLCLAFGFNILSITGLTMFLEVLFLSTLSFLEIWTVRILDSGVVLAFMGIIGMIWGTFLWCYLWICTTRILLDLLIVAMSLVADLFLF